MSDYLGTGMERMDLEVEAVMNRSLNVTQAHLKPLT